MRHAEATIQGTVQARKTCEGCRQAKEVAEFYPKHIATRKDGSTAVIRDVLCRPCRRVADRVAQEAERLFAQTAPKPHQRVALHTDFTEVAEAMAYPGVRYHDLAPSQRDTVMALAFELAKKYHADVRARKQLRGPVDRKERDDAIVILMRYEATDSIPFHVGTSKHHED